MALCMVPLSLFFINEPTRVRFTDDPKCKAEGEIDSEGFQKINVRAYFSNVKYFLSSAAVFEVALFLFAAVSLGRVRSHN